MCQLKLPVASWLTSDVFFCLNGHTCTARIDPDSAEFIKAGFYCCCTKAGPAAASSKPKAISPAASPEAQVSGSPHHTMASNSFSQHSVQAMSDPQWGFQCGAQTMSEHKLVLLEMGLWVRRQFWWGWLRTDSFIWCTRANRGSPRSFSAPQTPLALEWRAGSIWRFVGASREVLLDMRKPDQ